MMLLDYLRFKINPEGSLANWNLRIEKVYLREIEKREDSIKNTKKGLGAPNISSLGVEEEKKALKKIKEMHQKYIRLSEKYRRSSIKERVGINEDWLEWFFGRDMTAEQIEALFEEEYESKEFSKLLDSFAEKERIGKEAIEKRFNELLSAPLKSG